jgi:hypothetical protein
VIDPSARIHPSADLDAGVSIGSASIVWHRAQVPAGVHVAAFDPLLDDEEVRALGAEPWRWGGPGPFRAIVTQTADRAFKGLDAAWFADLWAVYDGRNSLRELALPPDVAYVRVGVQASTRCGPVSAGSPRSSWRQRRS